MQNTSLEIKHLFAESPLRRPVNAAIFAIVMVAMLVLGAYNLLFPLYGGATRMIQAFAIGAGIAIVASVPAILLVWFLDRREHESPWLLAGAAVWGAVVSASLSLVLSNTLYGYMLLLAKQSGGKIFGFPVDTLTAVLATPIVEEATKSVAILILFWLLRSDFDDLRDGLLYGAMVGLGFNAGQYTIFLLNEMAYTGVPPYLSLGALQFVFLGVNGHFVFSALVGAGFGLARQTHSKRLQWLAPIGGIVLAIYANIMVNSLGTQVINDLARALTGKRLLFAETPPQIVWLISAAGTLASQFWAYVVLGIAIYQSELWEIETMRRQLFGEVNVSVTPEEYESIQAESLFHTRTLPGYDHKVGHAIVHAQNELAFRKMHIEANGGDIEADELVQAWRARIDQLRGNTPAPVTAPAAN